MKTSTDDTTDKLMGCFALLITVAISMTLGTVFEGWVLTKLWTWFIVPKFGLPALQVMEAVGISVIISMLTHHSSSTSSKGGGTTEVIAGIITKAFLAPLMFLAIGYFVHRLA